MSIGSDFSSDFKYFQDLELSLTGKSAEEISEQTPSSRLFQVKVEGDGVFSKAKKLLGKCIPKRFKSKDWVQLTAKDKKTLWVKVNRGAAEKYLHLQPSARRSGVELLVELGKVGFKIHDKEKNEKRLGAIAALKEKFVERGLDKDQAHQEAILVINTLSPLHDGAIKVEVSKEDIESIDVSQLPTGSKEELVSHPQFIRLKAFCALKERFMERGLDKEQAYQEANRVINALEDLDLEVSMEDIESIDVSQLPTGSKEELVSHPQFIRLKVLCAFKKTELSADIEKLRELARSLEQLEGDLKRGDIGFEAMASKYSQLFSSLVENPKLLDYLMDVDRGETKALLESAISRVVDLAPRKQSSNSSGAIRRFIFLRNVSDVSGQLSLPPDLKRRMDGIFQVQNQRVATIIAQTRTYKDAFIAPAANTTSIDIHRSEVRDKEIEETRLAMDRKAKEASDGRVSFRAQHIKNQHIVDGNCHSVSLEFAKRFLQRTAERDSVVSRTSDVAREALSSISRGLAYAEAGEVGVSREIEERQTVFNAISVDSTGLTEDEVNELKIQATAASIDLTAQSAHPPMDIPKQDTPTHEEQKTALAEAFNQLDRPGVYLVRGVKLEASGDQDEELEKERAAVMRKGEVHGHSMLIIKTANNEDYFFDPNTGLLSPQDGQSVGDMAADFVTSSRTYWGLSKCGVYSLSTASA